MTPIVYYCVMDTITANDVEAPGAQTSEKEASMADIKKWVANDLKRALAFLQAIDQDAELQHYIATWFKGRMENAANAKKAAEQLKAQGKLFS